MKVLIILNDPPYGTERSYNGLRLAMSLTTQKDIELRVFLIGDAATSGMREQKVPSGYYNIEKMLEKVVEGSGNIGACGTCLDARGITEELLTNGVHRGSLLELTQWTLWADKIITF
ncbi:hypothetical protein COY52_04665 [Candidatus Desantisbacteria bacterium CG_4_10_14_0_8_um_filter_48_22]|uniref:Uncharacterized protein n=1 Tax=Candidatus Desantisbacteria bacterium CG_4_10_14_0_8_um_filter_48_22 TaxID=1974543 RepID=A0A2M7SCX8_9BACT|nr:MAG: hypothetical protein COY52_04665 [Candidatus Desantisbacteria bacterium CG_4_10_14_0_8_um_filter_48_22]